MSLPLLIAINVLADIALIAGLAHAMSRATRLTPHVASVRATQLPSAEQEYVQRRQTRSARAGRRGVARPGAAMAHQAGHAAAAYE